MERREERAVGEEGKEGESASDSEVEGREEERKRGDELI